MTDRALFRDHMRRGYDYLTDQPLCRLVIQRHAAARGNTFHVWSAL